MKKRLEDLDGAPGRQKIIFLVAFDPSTRICSKYQGILFRHAAHANSAAMQRNPVNTAI